MGVADVNKCNCKTPKHALGCFNRQNAPLQNRTPLKAKKAINRIGKVGAKWIETRHEWIKSNPGPWRCYLCLQLLTLETLTLDHVKSRARNPELRFEMSNLEPCCWNCNSKKGSRDIKELRGI